MIYPTIASNSNTLNRNQSRSTALMILRTIAINRQQHAQPDHRAQPESIALKLRNLGIIALNSTDEPDHHNRKRRH